MRETRNVPPVELSYGQRGNSNVNVGTREADIPGFLVVFRNAPQCWDSANNGHFFASLSTSIKVRVIHGIFLVFFDRRTSVRANPSAETGDLQKLIECFWRFTAAIHTVWFLCSVRIDEVGFFGVLFHNRCNQWCLFVQDKVREGRALQPDGVFFVTTHCNQFGLTKYESSTGKRLFICSFLRLFVQLAHHTDWSNDLQVK